LLWIRTTITKNKETNYVNKKKDLTGILSGYFSLMRLASACLLSVTQSINRMRLRLFYTENMNKVSIENHNQ
jgi:hypothetical protein